jgi:glutathione peroxidase
MSFYEIAVEDDKGQRVLLERYKNQVLLIVNSATNCIFTPQYKSLQALYDQFKGRGFEILDFPCNQFLNQAPGTIEEINEFCADHYETSFPRFAKLMVNGSDESILYTFLKGKKHGLFSSRIKWNFTKFLVDSQGTVVKRYAPTVKPTRIAKDIERLLITGGR